MVSLRTLFRNRSGIQQAAAVESEPVPTPPSVEAVQLDLDIAPSDPLLAYLQSTAGAVDITRLTLGSPALEHLRQEGVALVIPLVSHGELIGMINLGSRMSEQDYSSDDRKLLSDLASQAAPAVRVAQLVRQQQMEAQERERIEQELRVARLIQQTLLPKEVPDVAGWNVAAHYQPAREVGGDFYDFLFFDDGRVGIVIGDVTDKGVPAALVMATTRTLLRSAAERLISPGLVLERVNELLHEDIPPKMFVTCLYALLDPRNGRMQFANAGHDLPYRRSANGVDELRARGMPLGLMRGMTYEEKEIMLEAGDTVLFHSDGLAEAHDPSGELYGFPRLQAMIETSPTDQDLIQSALWALNDFTGPGWEQEDDVTLVTLHCTGLVHGVGARQMPDNAGIPQEPGSGGWLTLAELSIPSVPGNERQAVEQVAAAVQGLGMPPARIEKLKTAVAEATMNAMEHGNKYRSDVPVNIVVQASPAALIVRITDQGGGQFTQDAVVPDLEAKLAGLQSPRGWGLFLIQNMVDDMRVISDDLHHTVELEMRLASGDW